MSAIHTLAMLAAAVSLTLSGCSSVPIGDKSPTSVRPPVYTDTWRDVDEEIWRDVDEEIWGVSRLAASEAKAYARGAMGEWMEKVRQRTEDAFIPWYLDYWTQQWVSVKVAWYVLTREEGEPPATERLAAHLHEEYQTRVLQVVAQEIDPRVIRDDASAMYVRIVSGKLRGLANRYRIPPEEFRRRLAAIPAINIPGDPERSASLALFVHGDRVTASPAYAALVHGIKTRGEDVGSGDTSDELHTVARIAADNLAGTVAVRGGGDGRCGRSRRACRCSDLRRRLRLGGL